MYLVPMLSTLSLLTKFKKVQVISQTSEEEPEEDNLRTKLEKEFDQYPQINHYH